MKNYIVDRKTLLWGYINQITSFGSGVIILPVALLYFSSTELGIWWIMNAIAAGVILMDVGLSPVTARYVTFINSTGYGFEFFGRNIKNATGSNSTRELSILVGAIRYIYIVISLVVLVMVYLSWLYFDSLDELVPNFGLIWSIFGFSLILNAYYNHLNGLMIGLGHVGKNQKIGAISRASNLLVSIVLIYSNFGLLSIAIGKLVSVVLMRVLQYKFLSSCKTYGDINNCVSLEQVKKVFFGVMPKVWRMGVTTISVFGILRSGTLICGAYYGVSATATYGLVLQVITLINRISRINLDLQLPRLTKELAKGRKDLVSNIFLRAYIKGMVIYTFLALSFLFIGPYIIDFLGKDDVVWNQSLVVAFVILYGLEYIHGCCATFLTVDNNYDFWLPSLLTAFGVIGLSYTSAMYGMPIYMLVVCHIFSNIIFNSWYWPKLVFAKYIR